MADRPTTGGPADRVRGVERLVAEAIGGPRFIPQLVLHETRPRRGSLPIASAWPRQWAAPAPALFSRWSGVVNDSPFTARQVLLDTDRHT